MEKYVVNFSIKGNCDIEVTAENSLEAIRKARELCKLQPVMVKNQQTTYNWWSVQK